MQIKGLHALGTTSDETEFIFEFKLAAPTSVVANCSGGPPQGIPVALVTPTGSTSCKGEGSWLCEANTGAEGGNKGEREGDLNQDSPDASITCASSAGPRPSTEDLNLTQKGCALICHRRLQVKDLHSHQQPIHAKLGSPHLLAEGPMEANVGSQEAMRKKTPAMRQLLVGMCTLPGPEPHALPKSRALRQGGVTGTGTSGL